jgi:L-lactate utilization protein LutB
MNAISVGAEFVKERNSKLGPRVVQALKARHFDAWYFDDTEAAVKQVFSLIPKGDVISWGGSMTIDELGLKKLALEQGYAVIDRDTAKTPEERTQLMRKALTCDTFLASSNAISEDGELVNIDGFGNRVAAMSFGPRQVIVVAGMNKVFKTLDDALARARTISAPINHMRYPEGSAPCVKTGACMDCKSTESICSYIVTTRLCRPALRIKVILIGRDIGF